MAPCPVRRTKAAKARARKVTQSKVRSTKRRSPVSRSTQQRVESLGSAKTKIEAPLLKDFTKEYGIPKTQFAWGSREPSPGKESFDEEETAPPPVIIAPYFRYGSGMRCMLATHRPPASFKNSLLLQCPRPSLPHASQFLLKSSREMIKVPKRLSLMDFPAEVREHIYRGLLVSNKPIPVYDRWKRVYQREKPGLDISILITCKTIFIEARGVLYGENTFLYRLRDAPNPSQVMSNSHEVVNNDAYIPETGIGERFSLVFGGPNLPVEPEHEPGTINIKKYADYFRYITVEADHNRYASYTQEFMADAIKIFACEPYTTNIHTLRIIISPRYEGGKFTFADFFEPGSCLMVALRAVCCDTIRIKIQNKFLNEGLGVPSSELVLHVRQLRFYKHLRHDELRGKDDTERRDPWKKDSKMKQFRFEQLCKINDRLMALKRSVIRACKKHVKPHVVRRGDLGPMNWNADAEEEDWEDWDVQEQDDEGSEEDMDQEFEEPSDDNDSDYEM
ncbi:hypothetical protein BKA59DRAFT_135014 [Fusarium tricinctum]|uniref:Uncharacterized protein n=1 Tax=Fusarium tricinctum TaxID=61284 RepID=A0A8K0S4I4_9HYPO|nr:hypothetical protein BKA59DRAFT_135014 [Fusarium tricinctum]